MCRPMHECGSGHAGVLGDKAWTAPVSLPRSPKAVPAGKNYVTRERDCEGRITRGEPVTAGVSLPPLRVTLDKVLWAQALGGLALCLSKTTKTLWKSLSWRPPLYTMKVFMDFGEMLIFQVINDQNRTLRQCRKLKLNQEKIGLFVLAKDI